MHISILRASFEKNEFEVLKQSLYSLSNDIMFDAPL